MKLASPARAQYPKDRPSFFAQKFIRTMVKCVLATTLGPEAFTLLTVIATCEDAKRYRGPVTYYNGQLMPLIGVKTWNRLARIRTACVDAGWLIYIAPKRGDRAPGFYWVVIPADAQGLGDAPIDEDVLNNSAQPNMIQNGLSNEDQPADREPRLSSESDDQPNDQPKFSVTINQSAFYPTPVPVPSPSKKEHPPPSPPSLPPSESKDGDGDEIKNSLVQSGSQPLKPTGWWTGYIDAKLLRDREQVAKMYRDAVKSGLIQHTKLNGLRVVALSLQSLTANNPGGYFVSHVERQSWNYLAPENVIEAARRLSGDGLSFTPDELRMARELSV